MNGVFFYLNSLSVLSAALPFMIDVFLGITDQKEEYHSNSTDTNELKSVNETYPANSHHMAMNARRKKRTS